MKNPRIWEQEIESNWSEFTAILRDSHSNLHHRIEETAIQAQFQRNCAITVRREWEEEELKQDHSSKKRKIKTPIYFRFRSLPEEFKAAWIFFVRISESNSGNHPNFSVFHRKKLNEGLQSQINGESKKDFEKDSKKFETKP